LIQTDIFLNTGSSKKICEDYIIQGYDPVPFVILADGCSSSNGTEMGSRILCHLAKQYLRYRRDDLHSINYKKLGNWVIHNAELTIRQLGLSISCLDATLIIAYTIDNIIKLFMYGDGAIFTKEQGVIKTWKFDFTGNAPYYLSYLIDDFRHELYHNEKHDLIITTENVGELPFESLAYDYPLEFTFQKKDMDCMMIASDGMFSFINDDPVNPRIIQTSDLISDFMSFKTTKGEYLKRRFNKALGKLNEGGINHYDDLSVGAFI